MTKNGFLAARLFWLVIAALAFGLYLIAVPNQVQRLNNGFLGIFYTANPDGILVVSVFPGQPAAQAGILPGDTIIAIDNIPTTGFRSIEAFNRLNDRSGEYSTFLIRNHQVGLEKIRLAFKPNWDIPFNLPPEVFSWGTAIVDGLFILVHILLGALVIWKTHADRLAILMAFGLVLLAVRLPPEYMMLNTLITPWRWPLRVLLTLGYGFVPLMFSLFPNGRWYPRWSIIYTLLGFAHGIGIHLLPLQSNFLFYGLNLYFSILLIVAVGIWIQILRYRNISTPTERQQSKWILFGAGIGSLAYFTFYFAFAGNLIAPFSPAINSNPTLSFAINLAGRLYHLTLITVPLAIFLSITRSRLWDIDLIIRRTLVYSVLSIILASLYFGLVIFFQNIIRRLTGQTSSVAIAVSTLAITLLFAPLRRIVQDFINRRFYRHRFNIDHTLADFAASARDEVDCDRLTGRILEVLNKTVQPDSIYLWLASPRHIYTPELNSTEKSGDNIQRKMG